MQRQFKYFIELRSTWSGLEKNGVFSFWCLPAYFCDDGDDPSQFRATVEYLGRRNTFLLFSHLPRGMCDGQRTATCLCMCVSQKKKLWAIECFVGEFERIRIDAPPDVGSYAILNSAPFYRTMTSATCKAATRPFRSEQVCHLTILDI